MSSTTTQSNDLMQASDIDARRIVHVDGDAGTSASPIEDTNETRDGLVRGRDAGGTLGGPCGASQESGRCPSESISGTHDDLPTFDAPCGSEADTTETQEGPSAYAVGTPDSPVQEWPRATWPGQSVAFPAARHLSNTQHVSSIHSDQTQSTVRGERGPLTAAASGRPRAAAPGGPSLTRAQRGVRVLGYPSTSNALPPQRVSS